MRELKKLKQLKKKLHVLVIHADASKVDDIELHLARWRHAAG